MNTYDLQINQGETFVLGITVENNDGNPYDLTNFTVKSYLKMRYADTGNLINLNPAIVNASSGILSLNLSSGTTAGLPTTVGVYDVELVSITGNISIRPVKGNAYIFPAITF